MNVQEIKSAIMFGGLTNAQLDDVGEAIRYARAQLTKTNTRTLRSGDSVRFVSNRTGQTISGTVESVKIKNVIVSTAFGRYRVPANMLEAV